MRVSVLNISQNIVRNSNIGYGELRNYVCQCPTAILVIAAYWFPHKEAAIVKTSYKPHHLLVAIIPNAFNSVLLSSDETEM